MKKVFKTIFVVVGAFYTFVIVFGVLAIYLIGFVFSIKITDPNKYLQTDGKFSEFILFPKSLEGYDVVAYHYYDYQLKDGRELSLTVRFDEVSFERELTRLDSVTYTFARIDKAPKSVKKDEDSILFNQYTYVSIYNHEYAEYEYASVDFEAKEITFIYICGMSLERTIIDHTKLPKIYFSDDPVLREYHANITSVSSDAWID